MTIALSRVYLGSDHAGYKFKEDLKGFLDENAVEYIDLGTFSEESMDYPEIAQEVAEKVIENPLSRGVLICGTGIGVSMAANKMKGIRAALCTDENMAKLAREHNDANILAMGARVIDSDLGKKILQEFLETPFSGEEKHKKRVSMLNNM